MSALLLRALVLFAGLLLALGAGSARAQSANFHPCNAQPSLPICLHGYGRKIAVKRWGAQPEPLDADARPGAALGTTAPAAEIKKLKSSSALVFDLDSKEVLFARDPASERQIASLTKLMTALVVLRSGMPLAEPIKISAADRNLPSELPARLPLGFSASAMDLLHIALLSSENSAAQALARSYPGGVARFVAAMNAQALSLGMLDTQFADPSGLSNENYSTANDLAILLEAVLQEPLIRKFSSAKDFELQALRFNNTNLLVGREQWPILLSKTGTSNKAGGCLVMLLRLQERNLAFIILDSNGANGVRFGDAVRLRRIVCATTACAEEH